jgi:hypothetical protein
MMICWGGKRGISSVLDYLEQFHDYVDHRFLSMRISSGANGQCSHVIVSPRCFGVTVGTPIPKKNNWRLATTGKKTGDDVSFPKGRCCDKINTKRGDDVGGAVPLYAIVSFSGGTLLHPRTCHGIAGMYSMPDTSYDSCNIDHLFPHPVIVTVTHVDALFLFENCDSEIDGCLGAWPMAAVAEVGYDGHCG